MKGELVLSSGKRFNGKLIGVISREISGEIVTTDKLDIINDPDFEDKIVIFNGNPGEYRYCLPSEVMVKGIIMGEEPEQDGWQEYFQQLGINGIAGIDLVNLTDYLDKNKEEGRIELGYDC